MSARTNLGFLLLLALTWFAASQVVADEFDRESLKGLRTVRVVVERIEPAAERQGLSSASVQTDVELKLRQAGIAVESSARAWIYVNVNVLVPSQQYAPLAYCVQLDLHQSAALTRNPQIVVTAVTWQGTGAVGIVPVGQLSRVRESVRDMVEQFINDWLAVNGKR